MKPANCLHRNIMCGALALAVAGLTACSGGSNGASLTPASPTGAGKSGATFMIHVPHGASQGTQTQSASRKPAYISPATQSITVVITPQSGGPAVVNETVGLTPTSQGCTSTLASTLCELQVALNAGSYDATLTTFDGANGTGNTLSTAQNIPFTVVAGQNNQVNLTLSGIPARIFAALFVPSPHSFVIEAFDADNNVIVGSGAPSFAVTQTGGSLGLTLTQPTASAPNVFTAVPTSTNASATLSITASYPTGTNGCAQPGAVCTATISLTASDQLFASLFNTNETSFNVNQYAPPYTGAPLAASPGNVLESVGLALDATGNLFVADDGTNAVNEFAPPYTGSPVSTISNGVSEPQGLALDASGNLFAANFNKNTVTEYAAPYTGSAIATISNSVSGPDGLALDASGDLFVANFNNNTVTEYTTPYTGSATATISNSVSAPNGLALDASRNLFVANSAANTVTEYAPPYTGAAIATISNSVSGPVGLAFDANGNLFVANAGLNGTVTEYAPPFSNGSAASAVITLMSSISPAAPQFLTFFNTITVNP